MRTFLSAIWRVLCTLVEILLALYILGLPSGRDAIVIVAALILIYCAVRAVGIQRGLATLQMGYAFDVQFHEVKKLLGSTDPMPDIEDIGFRFYVNAVIVGIGLAAIQIFCLIKLFGLS